MSTSHSSSEDDIRLPPVEPIPNSLADENEIFQLSEPLASATVAPQDSNILEHFPNVNATWYSNFFIAAGIVVLLAGFISYFFNVKPLFDINLASSTPSSPDASMASSRFQPATDILGHLNNEIIIYDRNVSVVYSYDLASGQIMPITDVLLSDVMSWHDSGKLLFVTSMNSPKGNIYLLDLAVQNPKPRIVTRREETPYFPLDLQVDHKTDIAWTDDGEIFAFTSHDDQDQEWLFIFNTQNFQQITYTPASKMNGIAELLWVNDVLLFVAGDSEKEKRYSVDQFGGNFSRWGN